MDELVNARLFRAKRNYEWLKDSGAREHRYLSHNGQRLFVLAKTENGRVVYMYRKCEIEQWRNIATIIGDVTRHVERRMKAL